MAPRSVRWQGRANAAGADPRKRPTGPSSEMPIWRRTLADRAAAPAGLARSRACVPASAFRRSGAPRAAAVSSLRFFVRRRLYLCFPPKISIAYRYTAFASRARRAVLSLTTENGESKHTRTCARAHAEAVRPRRAPRTRAARRPHSDSHFYSLSLSTTDPARSDIRQHGATPRAMTIDLLAPRPILTNSPRAASSPTNNDAKARRVCVCVACVAAGVACSCAARRAFTGPRRA